MNLQAMRDLFCRLSVTQGDETNTLKNIINFLSFTAAGSTFSSPVSKYMFCTVSPPILDRFFSDISLKSFFGGNLPPGFFASHILPAVHGFKNSYYNTLPSEGENSRLSAMRCAPRLELCTLYDTKTFVSKCS